MSKKERDIWDDAIRSKLEDFEMDTLPGDWEAIADRLPGKAPVPLRRTLRYWVAAAVISLLVVSGGIYLYDREMEDLPIAQEIQSSQESTSVDTPVVPIEKTMEQAPVLATIPAAAVVKAKAASGAVKVGAKARMAAFRQNVESAVGLIKKGKAYVSDLTPDEIREYRGTLTEPGKEDPYSKRSVEENLDLFERMKNGEFEDGTKVLRARIDMSSSNINMRDPILYRVAHMTHHNTGDKWCVYPMYDFAHPIEDAIEGITHSICTLEFEDHRPLYDWVVIECGFKNSPEESPKQIEFAKLYLTNVVTGKRYIKRLVEDGIVDGWDDPRLVSIAALRRRGFTPESIQNFVDLCGISKANSSVDYAMLEYCIREDLKAKRPRMMAVLDPVKVIIDNYPEGQVEYLEVDNNVENPELGKRKVPFTRELYVEREDFMEEPPKKYFRMFPGNEVRFMNAYFVKCNSCVKDENGNVTEIHCTYDPASKGGNSPDGRKVKGTIHWVSAEYGKQVTVRLYENIVNEELGVYNEDGSLNLNPNSLTVLDNCVVEPELMNAKAYDSFQFVRNGFFCADCFV